MAGNDYPTLPGSRPAKSIPTMRGMISGEYMLLDSATGATATIGVRGSRSVYFAVTACNANKAEGPLSEEIHWPQNQDFRSRTVKFSSFPRFSAEVSSERASGPDRTPHIVRFHAQR